MADLNKVIQILKENKVEDEDIGKFILDLNNMVSEKVYIELVGVLDEKDFAEINDMTEDKGKEEVHRRFQEKTGKSVDDLTVDVVDGFVTGFLTEYHKQKLSGKGT